MVRSYEVMQRRSTQYDYEKVFWNATYSVALIGLGWVSVKLGQTILGVQKIYEDTTGAISNPQKAAYDLVVSFVEGDRKNDQPKYLQALILQCRSDPEYYAEWKANAQEQTPGIDQPTQTESAEKILNVIDGIYTKWGAAMPLLAVGTHVAGEYVRVQRIKGELKA